MDPLTIAAICSLVLKNQAASTAVPAGTDCAQIERVQQANAARASEKVGGDESDREAIGRVAYHEAGNQGDRGIAAVVYTIINRVGSGQFGHTVDDVLNAPRQFEPVSRAGGNWRGLTPPPPAARARIDAIVGLALRGELADETGGALYFQNPRIVAARERAGLVSRGLTNFGGQTPSAVIGDHSFYTGGGYRTAPTGQPAGTGGRDQADFIEAGGGLFGDAKAAPFDPAAERQQAEKESRDQDQGETRLVRRNSGSGDQQDVPPTRLQGNGEGAASNGSDRQQVAQSQAQPTPAPQTPADDVGGMFVLPNGRTSTGPK